MSADNTTVLGLWRYFGYGYCQTLYIPIAYIEPVYIDENNNSLFFLQWKEIS